MRNRVVDVQQVQLVVFRHFRHARGQRQAVRRILKQRISGNFHFVIVDARRAGIQPDGIGVGDEMHFVAAGGQLQAQFRGDNAAAAVSRITGDPDFMSLFPISPAASVRPDANLARRRIHDKGVERPPSRSARGCSDPDAPRRRRRTIPVTRPPSTSTVGSHSTFESQAWSPAKTLAEAFPNPRHCASAPVPSRRISPRSRPCTASSNIRAPATPPARPARSRRTRRTRPVPGSDCAAA